MTTKPLYVFETATSTGFDKLPVSANVLIEDYDGSGNPRQIILTSTTSIDGATDIGDIIAGTVGGYDESISIFKSNTFTGAQRTTAVAEDNIIDFTQGNDFVLTATAAVMGTPTVTGCTGQSGVITVHTASNLTGWDTIYKFRAVPSGLGGGLQTTDRFSYFIESETSVVIGLVT